MEYINFLQKEKPTIFKDSPFLRKLNTWINDDGVSNIITEIYQWVQLKYKGVNDCYKNIM
jgi:phage-related tail protein